MGGGSGLETIRAFVALELEPMSVRRFARIAEHLRMASGAPSAKWTPTANMHLTLKFLGEVSTETAVAIGQALATLAEGRVAPTLGALKVGAFPSIAEARVVVVELEDPEGDVKKLADRAERIAARFGIARESRPFAPHVTLARLKRAYDARRWLKPELAQNVGDCRTARLTLFRSIPGGEASTYVPLASFDFRTP
jgi:2'-5' RNA ligase